MRADNRVGGVRLASWPAGGVLGRQTATRSADDALCRSAHPPRADQRGVVSRRLARARPQQRLLRQRAHHHRAVQSPRSPEGTHRW